eukprot:scaffold90387_cov21-Tisochrysis_lutea.AAC.1
MAGDDKELRRWVSSRLHDLLGFSESTVAQFVLSVAKKHTSAESLASVLKQQGLPGSAETSSFATELLSRLGPSAAASKPAGLTPAQIEARQAKQFLKKSATYDLLEGPPEPAPAAPMPPPSAASAEKENGSKKEHKRERKLRDKAKSSRWQEDEDEEDTAGRVKEHKKQKGFRRCAGLLWRCEWLGPVKWGRPRA